MEEEVNFKHAIIGAVVLIASAIATPDVEAATITGGIDIGGPVTAASLASLTGVDFVNTGLVLDLRAIWRWLPGPL